jgi:hypothetical protein
VTIELKELTRSVTKGDDMSLASDGGGIEEKSGLLSRDKTRVMGDRPRSGQVRRWAARSLTASDERRDGRIRNPGRRRGPPRMVLVNMAPAIIDPGEVLGHVGLSRVPSGFIHLGAMPRAVALRAVSTGGGRLPASTSGLLPGGSLGLVGIHIIQRYKIEISSIYEETRYGMEDSPYGSSRSAQISESRTRRACRQEEYL